MITLQIDDVEAYDHEMEEFINLKGGTFRFKHNLIAVSLWESEFKKPFMTSNLTENELKKYYVHMCIDPGMTTLHITQSVYAKLTEYLGDPKTATVITNRGSGGVSGSRDMTSELIYSMMVAARVPFETETWNLNRLLTLLEVISIQNQPKEKMATDDIYKQNRDLNAQRKAQYNTKG